MSPVSLSDYADVFRSVVPGAELRPDLHGGVSATWHVRVTHAFGRAVGPDHAIALVTQLAEQMRIRAIRELGLEPILEAQRAEVRNFREANRQLQAMCDSRAARIADLEDALEAANGDGA